MPRKLRIGELAELAGVTTRTIRHYERLGLLDEAARETNGYRSYGGGALLALAEIKRLQGVGLSLSDIAGLRRRVQGADRDRAQQRLRDLEAQIDAEAAMLESRRRSLRELMDAVERGESILVSDEEPPRFAEVREMLSHLGTSDRGVEEERRAWAVMASVELPERWFGDSSVWYDRIKERAAEYAGAAEALDLFAGLRDPGADDELVDAVAARIITLIDALPATSEVAGEWKDDPAVWPVIRTIASGFTPAQQRAVAMVLAHFAKES